LEQKQESEFPLLEFRALTIGPERDRINVLPLPPLSSDEYLIISSKGDQL